MKSHIHYAYRTHSYTAGYGHREVQVCHCSASRSKTVVTPGLPTIRSDSEWSNWSEPLADTEQRGSVTYAGTTTPQGCRWADGEFEATTCHCHKSDGTAW